MSAERLPECVWCGCKFKPEPRSGDRQRVCGDASCVNAAERARKRKHYRRRKEGDPGFGASERARCRAGMRRLRARRAVERLAPAPIPRPPLPVGDLLTGLVSQLSGSSDPLEVERMLVACADRGRRLSVAPQSRGSPGGGTFFTCY